jgi:uncharacterized protein (DUF488 family)
VLLELHHRRGAAGDGRRNRKRARLARDALIAAAHSAFLTVGHSTHPLEAFAALVKDAGARRVVDVRTVPRSRTNPQYNRDTLPAALAAHGVGYEHLAALGGRRPRAKDVAPEVNAFWQNQSFHNYADYAMSPLFGAALRELISLNGENGPCAIMCSEGLWWRCHRRIIADYLMAAGERVSHILPDGKVVPAKMSETARPGPGGVLTYAAARSAP